MLQFTKIAESLLFLNGYYVIFCYFILGAQQRILIVLLAREPAVVYLGAKRWNDAHQRLVIEFEA
jgi:hypothetical protein